MPTGLVDDDWCGYSYHSVCQIIPTKNFLKLYNVIIIVEYIYV